MNSGHRWSLVDAYPRISFALCLLALASCSNDSESAATAGASAGGLAPVGSGGSSASGAGGAGASGSGLAGSSGSGGALAAAGSGGEAGAPTLDLAWDWAGVVGTGQSLAVGEPAAARNTPAGTPRATTQPFGNLKLSTGTLPWPIDPNDAGLTLVPLTEPIGRLAPTYPSAWPENISGETPHAAMANQITALVQEAGGADYVSVHGEVGENGQCLSFLVKGASEMGVNGRAFRATVIETEAITRLARAAGKTYGVGAIIVTHGECDAGNQNYADQLHQLWADYDSDLSAITGQTQPPLMIVSQQNAVNDRAASTLGQWQIGVRFPEDAVCSGPKYQYPYAPDFVHMVVEGYEQLGEKYAQVYFERVIRGRDWRPLQPAATMARREGRVITVDFHVPVPPLVWEDSFEAPHQTALTEWAAGKGFEVRAGGTNVAIESVAIAGDSVQITCATDLPATGVTVGYALTANPAPMATPFAGTVRWGQLRDSDPFVGYATAKPQPNFAVAFELPVQ